MAYLKPARFTCRVVNPVERRYLVSLPDPGDHPVLVVEYPGDETPR